MRLDPPAIARLALATMAALALAVTMSAATAQASAKPLVRSVKLKPTPSGQRSVTVVTRGRRFQVVMVCDLKATVCVQAKSVSRHRWSALLPAGDGSGRIGVIARSGGDYVFKG
jgi:hypothetical protein